MHPTLAAALAFLGLGMAVALALVLVPGTPSLPLDRRQPFRTEPESVVTKFASSAVASLEKLLSTRNIRWFNRETLENAGLRLSQAEFFTLIITGAFMGALIGWVVGGPALGLLMVPLSPVAGHVVVTMQAGKRRGKFDAQLGDTLQLLAGGLRAGHSILRAIDAAATESQAPTSEEMRRVVTETSLGRDLLASLSDTAARMRSEDFVWIAQAIQINREVGGNLAEVLDQVGETIRERNEIKGQIKALAAEGKFSAYILIAMPFGIVGMLMVANPGYMDVMFTHPLGWGMIAASAILMTIGSLWLRKIIDLKF